ncbi:hypothetical protein [Streptomyces sp. NPDC058891]|uniref:hypothetical protein n=1 Tax=Streptomyces sp. NPDC058891 TaxID=3346667 RepID=UPI003680B586
MAEKQFSFNTRPHVAKLGDTAELHFIPEVFGDQFLDGYKKIQDARERINGQTDLTALSSEELRALYAAMRTFLAGLMTPESAAEFLRFEVIKGGKTVADFRFRDEADAHAAGLAGARVEDKSMRLPDRVLTELLEWVTELYGGGDSRPTGSLSGSSRASRRAGTPSKGSSRSKGSTSTRGASAR